MDELTLLKQMADLIKTQQEQINILTLLVKRHGDFINALTQEVQLLKDENK